MYVSFIREPMSFIRFLPHSIRYETDQLAYKKQHYVAVVAGRPRH